MTADQTVRPEKKAGNHREPRHGELVESAGITATVVWMVSERGGTAFEE